jgi:OCT family organic cation transporter-like MFS transporter 4/5
MAATFSSLSDDLHSPILAPPSKNTTEIEKICIDDMLEKYCGEFGKWQLKHFILTCLAWALEAFHTMVMIFADREPDWRCVNGAECGGRSMCGMKAGEWEWIGGKSASTVSEWNLICGDKFKVGLVQAVFFAGCMIG